MASELGSRSHVPAIEPRGRRRFARRAATQHNRRVVIALDGMVMRTFAAGAIGLLTVACGGGIDPSVDDSNGNTSSVDSTGEPVVGWFELGFGDVEFAPLVDGGTLQVVWGGQGAAMFPLPLRGAEFTLPDPPSDYLSELVPLFDIDIDIEGFNDGPGNHFKHLANYPISFTVLPDGTYEYIYVAVLLPDHIDPDDLDGLPAHLSARLRPKDSAPFEVDLDLVVATAPPPI